MKNHIIIISLIIIIGGLIYYYHTKEIKHSYDKGYKDAQLAIKPEIIQGETRIDTIYLPEKKKTAIVKPQIISVEECIVAIDTFVTTDDGLTRAYISSSDIIKYGLIVDLFSTTPIVETTRTDTLKIPIPTPIEIPPQPKLFYETWTFAYVCGLITAGGVVYFTNKK